MKKLFFLFISILFVSIGFSQTYQDDLELIQSLYGMEKKEVVDEFVELNANQEGAFWELYAEYETKRKSIGKKKYSVLWNYVNDYGNIRAEDAEIIMNEILPLRKESDKLIIDYYKKVKSKTDAVVAMQFYQIENYLEVLVRTELLEELYISKTE
jgi:hypothetical protein